VATLIDWSTVDSQIRSYKAAYAWDTRSKALAHLLLDRLFHAEPDDVEDAITDGAQDRGVDAILIQDSLRPPRVHLFQVKCVEKYDKAKNRFPSREVDKLLSFIADLLEKREELKDTCNPALWEHAQEIWRLFETSTPQFTVHLAGNMERIAQPDLSRAESALRRHNAFTVKSYSLEDLAVLLVEARKPRLDGQLTLVDKQYFERSDGGLRGLVGTVEATEIVTLMADPERPTEVREGIFDHNVRIYLTSANRINERILATALSDERGEFWYLNNGITLTCEAVDYLAGTRAPRVRLTNVQIVNGGQTSHALFEAHAKDPEKLKDVLVVVRIIETKRPTMGQRIAETTNSQTPIRARDLRANDSVQLKLEEALRVAGFFYERKAGQYRDQPRSKRIDALLAAQAYVSYFLDLPHIAGKDRGKLFGELYDQVFSDDLTAEHILASLAALRPIEERKRTLHKALRHGGQFDPADLYLIDGHYHLLNALGHWARAQEIDQFDTRAVLAGLDTVTRAVKTAVSDERGRDPSFAHKKYFKSGRSVRDIHAQVETLSCQKPKTANRRMQRPPSRKAGRRR
jgi:hypothetical protein